VILVAKSPTPPKALAGGRALASALCQAYEADPDAYRSGRRQMAFVKRAYGAGPIKSALNHDQHGKCCYCESKFTHVYSGDVEHYRPKGAVTGPKGKLLPGYYWLAYEWDNLFFACAACNQTYKRDQFPLAQEADRALDHRGDLIVEVPLLVKPSGPGHPREHIRFSRDSPIGVTPAGEETIRIVGLARDELTLRRVAHIRVIETLCDALVVLEHLQAPGSEGLISRIRCQLPDATSVGAEFSSAAIDFVAGRGL